MVKLVFCLRKLPHLSLEEFQKYWFEKHGPLVRSKKDILKIRRYVQVHTLDHPINQGDREPRGGPEPYDGVAELWWDSIEDLQETSPERQQAGMDLLEDEKKFIDLSQSPLFFCQERPVIED